MNLGRIDLNLLRVFDAVFEERNLLRAGKRLHLSQSAISHALGRLREALQDDLFVRTARGMEPTARATAMAGPLRSALLQIQATLGAEPFEPQRAQRRFVVAANDYVSQLLLGHLGRRLGELGPLVDLTIRPSTRLDLASQIDIGHIDIAIGVFADLPVRFQALELWREGESLVLRKGHPLADRGIDRRALAGYPLVTVSLGGQEEGAVGGFIMERGLARQSEMFGRQALEDAYADAGTAPRVRIAVAHSLAIPALLRDTDMVALVPSQLAAEFARDGAFLARAVPYEAPISVVRAVWHRRNQQDPAHAWLRQQIAEVAGQLPL
ncbi:LysR family transcriptional regulator [Pseudomonas sp. JH-2]|uniref:LysR family transcriptional regulator n=1 Tax=Pseudomonas sp. JH-2 TaxID=3114998 RepID=UPI002E25DD90|nr:LysR family transcriptional regulator [Pseudomonas sp. JH-2]